MLRVESGKKTLRRTEVLLESSKSLSEVPMKGNTQLLNVLEAAVNGEREEPTDGTHPVRERLNVLDRVVRRLPHDAYGTRDARLTMAKFVPHGGPETSDEIREIPKDFRSGRREKLCGV